jgi:hypothetical protein
MLYHRQIRSEHERRDARRYVELCAVEPGLVDLLHDAMREQPSTDEFYMSFRPRVVKLAGWAAQNKSLRTTHDYDTVYQTIYSWVSR